MSRTPRASLGSTGTPAQKGKTQTDYEEFASLQLDKPNEGELKSSEEMKRHMFDDHFEGRPIERALHILSVGEEVQRLSVIRDLENLIRADEQGCLQRVLQKIHSALNSASTEFHIEAARSYSALLEHKAVSTNVFSQSLLPSVICHMDNRDQVVSNAWLETLLKVTEFLPVETLKGNILAVALNKGQISQNLGHRIAACKILGRLCTRLEQQFVKKDVLPIVLSLCQDVNESVRASICSQLPLVAKGIPNDMIKPSLIPILVELGRDETVQVRVEAIDAIVQIIPSLSQDVLKVTIIPLVKKICEQAVLAVDDTLVSVSRQFGGFCLGLENVLTQAEKMWMVGYYHNLSHMGIPIQGPKKDVFFTTNHSMDRLNSRFVECRKNCAYNFPAMAKFCSSSQELLEKLYPSFCDFSTDPYYMVRKTVGAGMHEVARILGANNKIVKNQVMTLLWDNMEEVLAGIIPELGKTIDFLISSGVLGRDQDNVPFDLGRGLLQCDKTIRERTHNWRLQTAFITQLESIVKCLPNDKVANNRLLLIRQFPSLKAMIAMPSEKKYLQTLESCLRSMAMAEKDRDVSSELRVLIYRVDKTETLSDTATSQTAEDLEDRRKYDEELKVAGNMSRYQTPGTQKSAKEQKPTTTTTTTTATATATATATTTTATRQNEAKVPLPSVMPSKSHMGSRSQFPSLSHSSSVPVPTHSGSLSVPPTHFVGTSTRSSTPSTRSSAPYNGKTLVSSQANFQGFTNAPNNMHPVRSLSTHLTNIDQNCTCYSITNFRSENLRNLNLLALVDTSLVNPKQKLSEALRQKLLEDPRIKLTKSAKRSMEISWLNLETDLKNELFALSKNRQIQGDRNFKEKSKFLTDFRNYNESTLRKFISEDREYRDTIYNVTGVGGYCDRSSNFFEERINFFERKIKFEDQKTATGLGDCSCYEVTTNWGKPLDEINKFSYFSKNFEEDFYRDAGVKANEIICRKFSAIPVQEKLPPPQISTPKLSASATSKRRTWFGGENPPQGTPIKLETITGYRAKVTERKKSETLPARESVSLKKLGIGPRSKSFVLPSTLIYSDKLAADCQSTKLIFDKEKEKKPEGDSREAVPSADPDANRFGFRAKTVPKATPKDRPVAKTKIPVGIAGNSSPGESRPSSPGLGKPETGPKPQANGKKKIPVVVSRKSMLIQSNSTNAEVKNNRRSLDPSKISLENMDKPPGLKRRSEKSGGKDKGEGGNASGGGNEEKGEAEPSCNGNLSKLPVRRSKLEK